MFNFLKKIFFEEEVLEPKEIKAEELEEWWDNQVSQIELKEEIANYFNEIRDKSWLLGEKLRTLEGTEIKKEEKERVDEKVKNVVLGHKDNYLREMRQFVGWIQIPEETSPKAALKFNEGLDKSLGSLAERTAKSYQAAQHLFFQPVEEIFKTVGEINLLVKDFDKILEERGFKRMREIEARAALLREGREKRGRLEEEIKGKELKLKRYEESREKEKKVIERLTVGEDYNEFKSLKEKEEEIRKLVEKNKDEVFLFFSKLGRALRKYEKVTMEVKIVRLYLEDGVTAFLEDENLKILGVLEGLGRSLEREEVELDEKQRETVLELIKKGKEGYLKELWVRGKEVERQMEESKAKLRRYTVDKQIEEAEYKLEHFEEQANLVRRETEELKTRLSLSGEEKLKEELKELINEVLKVEVKIV